MTEVPFDTFALVAYGPASSGRWKYESVRPRPVRPGEVLVRIVGSGICLADVHFGDMVVDKSVDLSAIWYPRVLGHEGSGYVEAVGAGVDSVNVGDPVILTFMSCGDCYSCRDDHPASCTQTLTNNWAGELGVYRRAGDDHFTVAGSFFGQSSFAGRAIVKERSVVSLRGLDVTEKELAVLAPLGCGVQTGCGAFTNVADAQAGQDVAVIGVGGVGQSAIMGAAMRGCQTIIAIDRVSSRLELAKKLGATHTIDTSDPALGDLVARVLDMTGGHGVHVSLDTTGVPALARQSWDFVRRRGKVLQVGLAPPDAQWDVSMADHMNLGKQIIGCVEGDAVPQQYVRQLVQWYRQGQLPVDQIVTLYAAADFKQALEDMRCGRAIKPVLLWP